MISNRNIIFFPRFILGGVFIWAGFFKISNPLGFAQSIANYQAFPIALSFFLALVLPWIEIICGFFLILGVLLRASALLFSALLIAFIVLVLITIFRGIDVDCGCFGSLNRKVDYMLVLQDLVLLFLSLNILFFKKKNQST